MATVDIVFLLVAAMSSLLGVLRGLVKEALSLASWVAAIIIATLFHPVVAQWQWLGDLVANDTARMVLAFGLLFVLTVFIGALVSNLFARLTSAAGLGGTDRLLGCLFGVLRGVIVVMLIVLVTLPFEFTRAWYQDSVLVPYIVMLSDYLLELWHGAPGDMVQGTP